VKVLHVIARVNRGGTATWLAKLIPGLRANGIETILAAGHVQRDEIEDKIFYALGAKRVLGLGRSISLTQEIKAFFELRKLIIELKPDVINTHTAKAGVLGRLAGLSLGKSRPALVHTYHGHLLYGYFGKWKTKFVIVIEKILSVFTQILISSGEKVRDELINVGIGATSQFFVIRPGIRPLTLSEKNASLEKFGLPNTEIIVGWLGRITEIKEPERVVEIAKRLPNLTFVMGGEGNLQEEIQRQAPKNLILVGWVSPEEIWGFTDIALLTSRNEAQPISLVEAALSCIPSIAWDVGSVSEVIEDGKTGYLVTSIDQAVNSIDRLSKNPIERKTLGNEAKNTALVKFSEEQFIDSHLKAYQAAIDKHNS
jgi:glycosyltransferase involved in cell wall biosynthesis